MKEPTNEVPPLPRRPRRSDGDRAEVAQNIDITRDLALLRRVRNSLRGLDEPAPPSHDPLPGSSVRPRGGFE